MNLILFGKRELWGKSKKCIDKMFWINQTTRLMHDWNDEDCVKILKNCRKAIPEKTGKIIIVDAVIQEDGDNAFDKTRLAFDLLMMVNTRYGKERTEAEWKKLLGEGGFPRYRIIKIPTMEMIIEGYVE